MWPLPQTTNALSARPGRVPFGSWRAVLAPLVLAGFYGLWVAAAEASDDQRNLVETTPLERERPSAEEIEERFQRLEGMVEELARQNQALMEENRRLAEEVRSRPRLDTDPPEADSLPEKNTGQPSNIEPRLPLDSRVTQAQAVDESISSPEATPLPPASLQPLGGELEGVLDSGGEPILPDQYSAARRSRFFLGDYDEGFVLVEPRDEQRTPFALKFNLTTEVRYLGFSRTRKFWTDSAGIVTEIPNRSFLTLNRSSFTFGGFAFSPQLQYNLTILTTTTTDQSVPLGYISYVFNDAISIGGGNSKVPGTREWLESYRYVMGVDRTMATTFFRPGFSPGVWINGEPLANFFYYAGVYDGLYQAGPIWDRSAANMSYTANVWWEPLGPFGRGYTDQRPHEELSMRTGSSLSYQRVDRERNLVGGTTNPENTILRLSDGTPIFEPNALGPGTTLGAANVILFSYDLSFKYRGLSLSGEYFARWVYGLSPERGAIPSNHNQIFDTGGFIQGSVSLVPGRLDLFGRTSLIAGPFGQGSEYGGGVNWYIFGSRNVRGNFEVKRIFHSPANNALAGYFAGDDGTLFLLQLMTDF